MLSTEQKVAAGSDYYVHSPSVTAHELLFYPLIVGRFVYDPGYHLHRTSFGNFLLMLIEKGTIWVQRKRERICASEGSAVLLDCYAVQEYGSASGAEVLWIHFDAPMARAFVEHIQADPGCVSTPGDYPRIRDDIQAIYEDFRDGRPYEECLESGRLYDALLRLLSMTDARQDASSGIRKAMTYISEHLKEPLRLDTLAQAACLSPCYFSRVFLRTTGMTPHQYVLETRLRSARFLLSSTQRSVKEIAADTGFADASSFCAFFRARTGYTPSAYRRCLLCGDPHGKDSQT